MAPITESAQAKNFKVPTMLFLFAFLLPTFSKYLGSSGAILVNGGILILLITFYFVRRDSVFLRSKAEIFFAGILALGCLYYMFAIGFSMGFLSRALVFRDFYELHRPLMYILILVLPYVLDLDLKDSDRIYSMLTLIFISITVVGFIQFFGISRELTLLYSSGQYASGFRMASPFGNAYDYGFIAVFYSILFLFRSLFYGGFKPAFLLIMALFSVLFTQSRSSFVALTICFFCIVPAAMLLFSYSPNAEKVRIRPLVYILTLGFAGVLGVVIVTFFYDDFSLLVGGINQLIFTGKQSSLTVRLLQLSQSVELSDSSLIVALFGNGPSKGTGMEVESAYAYYLFRYGVIGLVVLFIAPLASGLVLISKRILSEVAVKEMFLLLSLFVWFGAIFVISIGNNFTEQYRLSFIYCFMLGYVFKVCGSDKFMSRQKG